MRLTSRHDFSLFKAANDTSVQSSVRSCALLLSCLNSTGTSELLIVCAYVRARANSNCVCVTISKIIFCSKPKNNSKNGKSNGNKNCSVLLRKVNG